MNFLDHYLNYSASNEAPTIYHKWGGLSALSHLIGPRVWTFMGGQLSFYPNMYVNLVGQPGIKKSSAMKQAQDLIRQFKEITQAPASISKESMVQLMAAKDKRRYFKIKDKSEEYCQLAIFANEFVSLLNASGNPNGMIEFLTDIWDRSGSEYGESFKNSGDTVLRRPYVSCLACVTPKTLEALVSNKVISGGMSRRTLNIVAERNGRPIAFINPTKEQVDSWLWCVEHAKKLLPVTGEFKWTEEASQIYVRWYNPFQESIDKETSDVLRNFYMCKPEYVIKVSMLLALAEPELKLIHTEASFTRALALVTEVERGACLLFENNGRNELVAIAENIVRFVKSKEKASITEIKTFAWKDLRFGDAKEFFSMIEYLENTGKLKRVTVREPVHHEYFIAP